MKRVKGVEDLNICNIGAQGIEDVGAIIHMPIASFRAGESHSTANVGFLASLDFFRHACSRVCSDASFSKG
jgi:hypothetical protein